MNRRLAWAATLALALAAAGCATRTPMAFQDDAERVTPQRKPIHLMTVTLKNEYHTSFQPRMIVVHVEKPNAKEKSDRINFLMDGKAKDEPDALPSGNNYLLRMELEPGDYEIVGFSAMGKTFPIIGHFFAPLHANLTSAGAGVFYLGHVNATVRERQGNEFRAGPPIPLIDQAVAGASGGTFDVEIVDQLDKDEPTFRAKFPALEGIAIQKAVLPPFDRAKAQQWWETR
jgi:hypothetical protein